MSTRNHIIINLTGFQLGWFACVLMAANNTPAVGALIALMIVAFHVYLMKNRIVTLALLLVVTITGSLWDSILTQLQILVFDTGMISNNLAPYWIVTMWLLFATTLNVSLDWLKGRHWLAMLLGAISGPVAYLGGSALGAVDIPDKLLATSVLALGWAALMPLLMMLTQFITPTIKSRANP